MKRVRIIIALILAFVLCFSMSGCGSDQTGTDLVSAEGITMTISNYTDSDLSEIYIYTSGSYDMGENCIEKNLDEEESVDVTWTSNDETVENGGVDLDITAVDENGLEVGSASVDGACDGDTITLFVEGYKLYAAVNQSYEKAHRELLTHFKDYVGTWTNKENSRETITFAENGQWELRTKNTVTNSGSLHYDSSKDLLTLAYDSNESTSEIIIEDEILMIDDLGSFKYTSDDTTLLNNGKDSDDDNDIDDNDDDDDNDIDDDDDDDYVSSSNSGKSSTSSSSSTSKNNSSSSKKNNSSNSSSQNRHNSSTSSNGSSGSSNGSSSGGNSSGGSSSSGNSSGGSSSGGSSSGGSSSGGSSSGGSTTTTPGVVDD